MEPIKSIRTDINILNNLTYNTNKNINNEGKLKISKLNAQKFVLKINKNIKYHFKKKQNKISVITSLRSMKRIVNWYQ